MHPGNDQKTRITAQYRGAAESIDMQDLRDETSLILRSQKEKPGRHTLEQHEGLRDPVRQVVSAKQGRAKEMS